MSSDGIGVREAAPGQLAPVYAPVYAPGLKPNRTIDDEEGSWKTLPTAPSTSPAEDCCQARASALENSAVVFQRNRREVGFESIFAKAELGQSFAKSLLLRKLRSPVR